MIDEPESEAADNELCATPHRRKHEATVTGLNWTLIALYGLLAISASWHALLTKRDPRAAMGWIAVCLFSPILGSAFYYLFGINRVARRARDLRSEATPLTPQTGTSVVTRGGLTLTSLPDEYGRLVGISNAVARRPLVGGNHFDLLCNGDEAYPAMLAAIESAQSSINLQTYIFQTDAVGLQFIEALRRAVRRGADVRVLIDGAGDYYAQPRASRLLDAMGVRVGQFLPPRLIPPSRLVNLRNHRKILVVDGREAFVGGMNIRTADVVVGDGRGTRDIHFRVSGPVVSQVLDAFIEDWRWATSDESLVPLFEPPSPFEDGSFARVITDGPDEEVGTLSTIIASAVSAAAKRIGIMTPYFLPTLDLLTAIESAALRGIEVSILLPSKNNLPYVHWASRHILGELLKRGVSVYYQPAPFVHSKLLIIDDHYVQIGSANLDSRSLRLNFELNIEVFNSDFARVMAEHYNAAMRQSVALTMAELENRSFMLRTRDAACWLMSPYL